MRDHIMVVYRGVEISRQPEQAILHVQYNEHRLIFVKTLERYSCESQQRLQSLKMYAYNLPNKC
jgi:hypothetical protein